jgi:hypothetical protein
LHTFYLHSSLSVRGQVSHPYKKKNVYLYIFICKFLDRRPEDKFHR